MFRGQTWRSFTIAIPFFALSTRSSTVYVTACLYYALFTAVAASPSSSGLSFGGWWGWRDGFFSRTRSLTALQRFLLSVPADARKLHKPQQEQQHRWFSWLCILCWERRGHGAREREWKESSPNINDTEKDWAAALRVRATLGMCEWKIAKNAPFQAIYNCFLLQLHCWRRCIHVHGCLKEEKGGEKGVVHPLRLLDFGFHILKYILKIFRFYQL